MDYQVIIGFSTRIKPSLISRLIQFVERTPYSHVYMRVSANSLDRELVYHASEDNLHFMNFDEFKNINNIIEEYIIPISAEEKKKVLQYCIDRAGRHYGKREFVGIGAVRLVKWLTGRQIKNPLRNEEKTMVCSELVGRILIILGSSLDPRLLEIEGPKFIKQELFKLNRPITYVTAENN